jgi:hypothetical protein
VGTEAHRRGAWNQLLDATSGADPGQPVAKGGTKGSAAGAMPQKRPGVIPPHLPSFAGDPADVAALKSKYNVAIDQLHSAAGAISGAATDRTAAAQAAALLIRTAIDNDGLNNPSGFLHRLSRAADDVGGFVASHWAQFVADLANPAR